MQNQVCLTKLESMCTLLTHNTLKLKSLTFRDFIDIELCHEKHRWPLPNLLWEPHHHWWPLLSWRWIVSLRASSNGDLSQVHVGWFPTSLRPSFFPHALRQNCIIFWFQVSSWTVELGTIIMLLLSTTFLSPTRWIENYHAFVTKILGTTFMRSYLCVTQQDKMLLLRDTQQ